MRRTAPRLTTATSPASLALATAVLLLSAAGCSSWQTTRERVIDPIHALLHHDYPHAFEERDPAALAALFAASAPADATAPSLALLESFREVVDARGDIERVDLEAEPVRAWVQLRLDGVGHDGRLRTVFQHKEFVLSNAPPAGGGEPVWRIAFDRPTPVHEVPTPDTHFVDEALLRGLWFHHQGKPLADPDGNPRRYVFGSGVAAADLNGDGWDDVVLVNGDRVALFLNERGWFRDASEEWGLGALPRPERGVLTVPLPVDVDNDGDRDLFVGAEFAQPLLLRNEGGRFATVEDSGIRTTQRTISAVAADFDGDGFADLFLANHEDVFHEAPNPPWSKNAEADQLFLNRGDGTFVDVTREAGVGNKGWSLTPVAADYDGDGDVDLFVGNDFGDDVLFRNDGRARFEEVSGPAGVDRPVAAMGADWGDYDADGDFDLFVAGMASGSGWVLEVPDFEIRKVPRVVDALFRPHVRDYVRSWFRGNRLYQNQGDGTFVEIAAEAGAQKNGWSWASVWLDFDNDGLLDVYNANGFLSGPLKDDL